MEIYPAFSLRSCHWFLSSIAACIFLALALLDQRCVARFHRRTFENYFAQWSWACRWNAGFCQG